MRFQGLEVEMVHRFMDLGSNFQSNGETSNVVWSGESGTDQKTGGKVRSGRFKDVELLFGTTIKDRMGNKRVRGTAQVGRFGDKFRRARLRRCADEEQ